MERTFTIIKPDAVEENNIGEIVAHIEKAGFAILGMKMSRISRDQAESFYAIHKGKVFFNELMDYITRSKVVVMALEKNNAISDFRKLIGATNPDDAEPGTIRKKYAKSIQENAVHGSDSVENGILEVGFFFSESELI